MRLISLLILVAIVGFGAFVFFVKPEWIGMAKKKVDEAIQTHIEGYPPAKSPHEACEQFLKAVQARNYKAAAVYSTKDYGDKLIKSHDGARALGNAIASVKSYLDEKQYNSDKTTQLLFFLDPFPAQYLKLADVQEVKGKKDEKGAQVAAFLFNPPTVTQGYSLNEMKGLDQNLFFVYRLPGSLAPALAAPTVVAGPVEIKSEGEGEEKIWKIHFPVPQKVREGIEYFNSHYKSYVSGLDEFRGRLRQDRYLKDKIAPELLDVLVSSK